MSVTALATRSTAQLAEQIENVLINGDLSKLTSEQRVQYYNHVCESLGLNPLTKPFDYINLSGKLTLYAKRDATEQLRKLHGVSITSLEKTFHEGLYVVTALAQDRTGRTDASTGAVTIVNLKGEALANALMKAETKAKRRVTLSICGLGLLDETEVESIATRPPLVVEPMPMPEAELPALPTGARRIVKVTKAGDYAAEVILDDGREVWANGAQMIALLEQLCQEGAPVDLTTRTVKRRKAKEGKPDTYEAIEEVQRWKSIVEELAEAERTGHVTDGDIPF